MEDKQNTLNKVLYLSIGIILLFLALLFSIIAFIQKKDIVYFYDINKLKIEPQLFSMQCTGRMQMAARKTKHNNFVLVTEGGFESPFYNSGKRCEFYERKYNKNDGHWQ